MNSVRWAAHLRLAVLRLGASSAILVVVACGGSGGSECDGEALTADLRSVYEEEEARLGWSAPAPLVYLAPSERPTWETTLANDPGRNWCIAGTIVECPECRRGFSCARGEYRGYAEGCPVVVIADMASDRDALFGHESVHHLVNARTGDPDAGHAGAWW